MTWRDLPQSAAQLREAGLSVIGVYSPTHNVNPSVVYVRWNHVPEGHETQLARHFIPVEDLRHIGPDAAPKGCPWE